VKGEPEEETNGSVVDVAMAVTLQDGDLPCRLRIMLAS